MVNRTLLFLTAITLSAQTNWPTWSGGNDGNRYSPLKQITKANAKNLKVAWEFHSGDADARGRTMIQCTPSVIDGVLYGTTPTLMAVALDAASGKEIWRFDPVDVRSRGVNRGVMYWADGADKRVLFSAGNYLYALDAKTGKVIPGFGANGRVDMSKELDRDPVGAFNGATTPGIVYKDLIIMGSSVGEGPRAAAPGHIRAYDARTGKRRWIFHTIPHPGEVGYETWPKDAWKTIGGTNNWGGMSLDEKRGVVYVSLGSPAFDFYGGDRVGDNLFGNAIVALEASTGKRIWHYQTLHHDVWDWDLPANPNLVKWNGKDALAQITKQGFVFVLDRETGKPLIPVEERPVPSSDMPGEVVSKTQPFPVKPPPFSSQKFEPSDVTPEAEAQIKRQLADLRNGGMFAPPSRQGTVVLPGTLGGGLWGGAAADPAGNLYVNSQNVASVHQLIDAAPNSPYPYALKGYTKIRDDKGKSGAKPPWGLLTAINLNKGEFSWQKIFGKDPSTPKEVGTENMGGPAVSASGLLFIGATKDELFRVYDTATGAILFEHKLPAGGYATPAIYSVNGKQYIAIACGGGGRMTTKSGDAYVAFALP